MHRQDLSDSAQISRAAKHLIETHGSRAASVALKRAAYLHQCGEELGADTWRRIGDFVRAIQTTDAPRAGNEGDGNAGDAEPSVD